MLPIVEVSTVLMATVFHSTQLRDLLAHSPHTGTRPRTSLVYTQQTRAIYASRAAIFEYMQQCTNCPTTRHSDNTKQASTTWVVVWECVWESAASHCQRVILMVVPWQGIPPLRKIAPLSSPNYHLQGGALSKIQLLLSAPAFAPSSPAETYESDPWLCVACLLFADTELVLLVISLWLPLSEPECDPPMELSLGEPGGDEGIGPFVSADRREKRATPFSLRRRSHL